MNTPQLRSSQVITTFGPGAMVDLPDASLLVAGLERWHFDHAHLKLRRAGEEDS